MDIPSDAETRSKRIASERKKAASRETGLQSSPETGERALAEDIRASGRDAQFYESLSLCNEAMLRCASPTALFQDLCRIAVQSGGLKLAWVGEINHSDRSIQPVASAGDSALSYLDGLEISTDPDSPFGRGPIGTAVREGRPAWFEDFLNDPRTAPWHERGKNHGLVAGGALPLKCNGSVCGVFTLYAGMAGAFDEDARDLLARMTANIGFALDKMHQDAERLHLLDELRESEQRYRCLVEQSLTGVYLIQGRKMVYVNPRMAEMLGYDSAEELIGRDPLTIVAGKDRDTVAENIRLRLAGEIERIGYNFTAQCKQGHTVEVGANGALATYRGQPAIIGLMQDITEKLHAEKLSRQHMEQLESAFLGTVKIASNLTNVRDSYTSHHARRVGEIASAIGAELGLDASQQKGLFVAGSLHDIGKITIPMEILSSLEPLTPRDYEIIREHPRAGYDILKDLELPWPVAKVAYQHHERMDGSGYPEGLRGEQIILEARIVMVADVVESMSHARPYRDRLGLDRALEEIEGGMGRRYDPDIAKVCLKMFRTGNFELPA